MHAIDLIGLLVPLTYLFMLAVEAIYPARAFPPRRGWRWLGLGFLVLMGVVSTVVPLVVPATWAEAHRWMDGTRLGVAGGTVVGYVVLSALMYVYHRAVHAVPLAAAAPALWPRKLSSTSIAAWGITILS